MNKVNVSRHKVGKVEYQRRTVPSDLPPDALRAELEQLARGVRETYLGDFEAAARRILESYEFPSDDADVLALHAALDRTDPELQARLARLNERHRANVQYAVRFLFRVRCTREALEALPDEVRETVADTVLYNAGLMVETFTEWRMNANWMQTDERRWKAASAGKSAQRERNIQEMEQHAADLNIPLPVQKHGDYCRLRAAFLVDHPGAKYDTMNSYIRDLNGRHKQ